MERPLGQAGPADPLTSTPAVIETDALVIGAGPVGLFQVFQLGLQEIRAHVVDSLPSPGGQCVALYADKPIYDIPALPYSTGRGVTDSLLAQIQPFGATFHFGQTVDALQRQADGRFAVGTSGGQRFLAKTVFIAAGVGAFQPRPLKVPGVEAYAGGQLHYHVDDPATLVGQRVVISGADDHALEQALQFACGDPAHRAASVVLVHRTARLDAPAERVERMQAACAAGHMRFVEGQISGIEASGGRLTGAVVSDAEDRDTVLPLDALLVFHGLSPRLGPVAHWGLALERRQLVVDTAHFATSEPGIFAVGDINTYPGKRKLIVCGFHEATLAAFAAAAIVHPDRRLLLQYTTTSPRLHALLGVQTSS